MAATVERHLNHNGCTLHYWTGGPPEAMALVFCHGAMLDHRSWDAQVDAFAGEYRTIAVDLRGHGASSPGNGLSVAACADDLIAILEKEAIPKAIFVGLSFGGLVIQQLARRHPDRVAAFACFGTAPIAGTKVDWFGKAGFAAIRPVMSLMASRWLFRQLARTMFDQPDNRRYFVETASSMTRRDLTDLWRDTSEVFTYDEGYTTPLPLLIAYGSNDRAGTVARSSREWADATPGARLEVIPGAGHVVNQDAPIATNTVLRAFLDTLADHA